MLTADLKAIIEQKDASVLQFTVTPQQPGLVTVARSKNGLKGSVLKTLRQKVQAREVAVFGYIYDTEADAHTFTVAFIDPATADAKDSPVKEKSSAKKERRSRKKDKNQDIIPVVQAEPNEGDPVMEPDKDA